MLFIYIQNLEVKFVYAIFNVSNLCCIDSINKSNKMMM